MNADWTQNPILNREPPATSPVEIRQVEARAQCFVFGSNLSGVHGAGAALHAAEQWGAVRGVGAGPTGRAYALPTKGALTRVCGRNHLPTLPLSEIGTHASLFALYARENPSVEFRLTAVGCGLAGYTAQQIAPLFTRTPANVLWPPEWRGLPEAAGRTHWDYPEAAEVGGGPPPP